ncbi:MAG: DUF456 domain-containing protein [Candidatus Methylacidiphilales bacterium]
MISLISSFLTTSGEMIVWMLLLLGLVGAVLPLLPGTPLVFCGVLLHKLLFPEALSWWTVVIAGVGVILALLADWLGGVMGARWLGAGKWGMLGALLGGIVGLFFSLPGLILGPIVGAVVFEACLARKKPALAAKAGAGVIVGILASNVAQLLIGLIVILIFCADAYNWW